MKPKKSGESGTSEEKKKRTKTVPQKYKQEYSLQFPVVTRSGKSDCHFFCNVCRVHVSVAHGGLHDVKKHLDTDNHKAMAKLQSQNRKVTSMFMTSDSNLEHKVMTSEIIFTNFLVENNVHLAAADHSGEMFRRMFPDSEIAKKVS